MTTSMHVPSAHVDTFARDRLPPRDQWPDLPFDRPELDYPERLNVTSALLDPWLARGWAPRPCLIAATGTWSWGDLAATVDRIAGLLVEEHGLVPGNRVLLRGPNTPMLAACWLAVAKAGGIVVATMPLLRAAELTHILEKAEVDLALCDARFLEDLSGARASVRQGFPVLAFNAANATDSLEARIAGRPAGFAAVDTAADDICLIAFTSGTTGRPKATAHFHRDMLAVADLSPRSQLGVTPDDVFCGSPSIAFAYGLGGLMLFPLRAGACSVLIDRPTPEGVLQAIARHKGTVCFTVPTVYRSMSALIAAGGAPDTGSLRACVSAGEPLTPSTFDDWKRLTGLPILDTLGTTELLNAVLASPPDAIRPGATGKPVPGYEATVLDEWGEPLPPGQVGRLAVRGPTGCRYLDDPRQEGYVVRGWNITGDACHMDEDGYFWHHGRVDDLIVSAGYKIAGMEIEDALLQHPLVEECAVIAAPDPIRGAVPKAFLVLRPGTRSGPELAREIQDHVKALIAPFKYPRRIEFLEQLPRTETGKIQRFKLRQREWQDADTSAAAE
ncbi:MAG TPA: AMP-binding protein [Azospirillum sp.]|nr:AMP-binding protein [Azospirillum sp.]